MRLSLNAALATGVIAAVGFFAAATATVSRDTPSGTADRVTPAGAPHEAGMVVSVDPETGELGMPSAEQLGQALSIEEAQAYARQIASELVTVDHPDGSSSLIHDDRLADYSVATIGPDGKPVFVCVHGAQAAQNAVSRNQPIEPGLEEK